MTAERVPSGYRPRIPWIFVYRSVTRSSRAERRDKLQLDESASALSSINLAHDGVERADDRDHVRDERVAHARRRRLQRDEGRRAELDPPRLRAAVRDHVAAELAARRLDRDVDLALGHAVALGDDLEVVDQGLHRGVELVPGRQHDAPVVHDPRLTLHSLEPVEALVD